MPPARTWSRKAIRLRLLRGRCANSGQGKVGYQPKSWANRETACRKLAVQQSNGLYGGSAPTVGSLPVALWWNLESAAPTVNHRRITTLPSVKDALHIFTSFSFSRNKNRPLSIGGVAVAYWLCLLNARLMRQASNITRGIPFQFPKCAGSSGVLAHHSWTIYSTIFANF